MAVYSSIFISAVIAAQPAGWAIQYGATATPYRLPAIAALEAPVVAAWGAAQLPAAAAAGVLGAQRPAPAWVAGWGAAGALPAEIGGWATLLPGAATAAGQGPADRPAPAWVAGWSEHAARAPQAALWQGAGARRGAVIFNEMTRATGASPGLAGLSQLTVELWVKPAYSPRGAIAMQRAGTPPGHTGWQLWFESYNDLGDVIVYFDLLASNAASIQRFNALTLHRWNHIAATFNGEEIALYSNGVRRGAPQALYQPASFPAGDYGLTLGPYDNLWFYGYVGRIGFVRISSTVRYTGTSYTPPARPPAIDAYTIAQYNFDERGGTTLHDASGNGYHLTIFDGAWVGDTPPGWGG